MREIDECDMEEFWSTITSYQVIDRSEKTIVM